MGSGAERGAQGLAIRTHQPFHTISLKIITPHQIPFDPPRTEITFQPLRAGVCIDSEVGLLQGGVHSACIEVTSLPTDF